VFSAYLRIIACSTTGRRRLRDELRSCPDRGEAVIQPQQSSVRNRLLGALSPEDFALLPLQHVHLPLTHVLIEPKARIEHMYFIEEGMASIVTDTLVGKVEIGMVGREGLVAAAPILLGSDHSPYQHFMQMSGAALQISTRDLLEAVDRSPSLRALMLCYIQAFLIQVAQTAFANAVYTIEIRLARWLLMCHDRAEGDDMVLTHEFLAQMLGVRRPGVSVATQILEGNRLIRAKRGRITILDRAGLEAVADEGYGLAEAQYAALIEER